MGADLNAELSATWYFHSVSILQSSAFIFVCGETKKKKKKNFGAVSEDMGFYQNISLQIKT